MPVPREILDALESIIGIYFSDVRHRHRASFILCDELVEMACKLKARQHNHQFDMNCGFHAAWTAPGVGIPQNPLGDSIQQNRDTRNTMQHQTTAATVDDQFCADAILDALKVIEHCWPGSSTQFSAGVRCAIRVVRLYSTQGNANLRQPFEDAMREANWRAEGRAARINEFIIRPGLKQYWALPFVQSTVQVETILDGLGVP